MSFSIVIERFEEAEGRKLGEISNAADFPAIQKLKNELCEVNVSQF